ncbi:MAG: C39 family peptidase [Candidatus Babeliaceae bacterium]
MKKKFILIAQIILLTLPLYASELRHRSLPKNAQQTDTFIWEKNDLIPFDELIISWDAQRPSKGYYLIQVSLFTKEWSSWLNYAFWGVHDQHTFKDQSSYPVKTGLAAASVADNHKATGFKIKITAHDGASLKQFRTVHASTADITNHLVNGPSKEPLYINLEVPGISQMALPTEINKRICSPTSTTAVIRFLKQSSALDPLTFAPQVFDTTFNIYGNWIFNTAQAIHELGAPWHCCVARLNSFNNLLDQLKKGYPIVVSVKGPLPGSAEPYESGHLLVVKGYDSQAQQVLCMDPAFQTDELTNAKYNLEDFLTAWRRRFGLAYIFYQ